MKHRQALTVLEKEQIYKAKLQGKTIPEIAAIMACSPACVRKWWRCGRDYGIVSLQQARRGRGQSGKLSQFDPGIARRALELKEIYSTWGPDRILIELEDDPLLQGLSLPASSTLAAYFKEACPQWLRSKKKKRPRPHPLRQAQGVHEIWQLDHQEGIRLDNGEVTTICNIRDPFAAAIIMSQVFIVTTAKHWRKLRLAEVQSVLRQGFVEWQTMPHMVQTDNELGLAGSPKVLFPSQLTLWLVGLGIQHQLIRPACPTDQAAVERTHRTLDGFALHKLALANRETLQASLDKERSIHNERFPSPASDCNGLPPLVAHPQLRHQPRPYQFEHEFDLFHLRYVADHLATYALERIVNTAGQVSLGGTPYYIGTKYGGLTVCVRFDACAHQWVFTDTATGAELRRKEPRNFSVEYFTDLEKPVNPPETAIQLSFSNLI